MKNITVVIPTMLLCPLDIFEYSLTQFNNNDFVKEIVIIDNTESKEFDKVFHTTDKMNVLKFPGNQGASYNIGMQFKNTKYYLLVNDDVACRSSILNNCVEIMETHTNIGLLQINTIENQPLPIYINSYENKILEFIFPDNPRNCMTGWFQFGRFEDWIDIPIELKYFYGDDLMLENIKHKQKHVARIISDHISHITSSTMNTFTNTLNLIQEESIIYDRILQDIFQ